MGCNNLLSADEARQARGAVDALKMGIKGCRPRDIVTVFKLARQDALMTAVREQGHIPVGVEKSDMGFVVESRFAEYLADKGYNIIFLPCGINDKGIDIATVDDNGKIHIFEMKSSAVKDPAHNKPALSKTKDGKQMSKEWFESTRNHPQSRLEQIGLDLAKTKDVQRHAVLVNTVTGQARSYAIGADGSMAHEGGAYDSDDLFSAAR
ncbi:MAG: hypothetical protein LBI64_06870 [Coriobacteriales bacterium]|jgi:hypothetical protein|nr:hypothetical protein [Coriobacteriales bacterium]